MSIIVRLSWRFTNILKCNSVHSVIAQVSNSFKAFLVYYLIIFSLCLIYYRRLHGILFLLSVLGAHDELLRNVLSRLDRVVFSGIIISSHEVLTLVKHRGMTDYSIYDIFGMRFCRSRFRCGFCRSCVRIFVIRLFLFRLGIFGIKNLSPSLSFTAGDRICTVGRYCFRYTFFINSNRVEICGNRREWVGRLWQQFGLLFPSELLALRKSIRWRSVGEKGFADAERWHVTNVLVEVSFVALFRLAQFLSVSRCHMRQSS